LLEGADVILCDLLEDEGRAVARQLGSTTVFVRLDVRKQDDWTTLSKRLSADGVDVLKRITA